MAGRPTKQGIDYFPLDCEFDDDMKLFILEYGGESVGIIIALWQIIYKNEGYYADYDRKLPLKIKQRIGSEADQVRKIIEGAVEFGIFDKVLFDKYNILTSSGIQSRFLNAAAQKKQIRFNPEYALINLNDFDKLPLINPDGNLINQPGNSINPDGNTQSKVKESKVKESKVNEREFSDENQLNFISELYSKHTKIKNPQIEAHIKPLLEFLHHLQEPLTELETRSCMEKVFDQIQNKNGGIRVDLLVNNIQAAITSKKEKVYESKKKLELAEAAEAREKTEKEKLAQKAKEDEEKIKYFKEYITYFDKNKSKFNQSERDEILKLIEAGPGKYMSLANIVLPKMEELELI